MRGGPEITRVKLRSEEATSEAVNVRLPSVFRKTDEYDVP